MSDYQPPVPSRGNDRVRDTLTALRVDAESCGLSDAASVRRRGQARTRHQALAGVGAAVVAVVAVVTGSALLGGQAGANHPIPPATQSPSPHALQLAPEPLLLGPDVGVVGPYQDFQRNPDPVDEQQRPMQCIPNPTALGAVEGKAALFYVDTGDATFIEHVLRFGDAATAGEAVTALSTSFATCDRGKASEVSVDDRGPTRRSVSTGDRRRRDAPREPRHDPEDRRRHRLLRARRRARRERRGRPRVDVDGQADIRPSEPGSGRQALLTKATTRATTSAPPPFQSRSCRTWEGGA